MAKVSFNKITPIKKAEDISVTIGDEIVILKSYLPIVEKSELIEAIVNGALDTTNHINDMRAEMLFTVYVIQKYSNISFTEKQLENIPALYDLIKLNNIDTAIFAKFNNKEYMDLRQMLEMTINHVNEYINSFAGVLNIVNGEQNNSESNIDKMLTELQTLTDNSLIKDVMDNLENAGN